MQWYFLELADGELPCRMADALGGTCHVSLDGDGDEGAKRRNWRHFLDFATQQGVAASHVSALEGCWDTDLDPGLVAACLLALRAAVAEGARVDATVDATIATPRLTHDEELGEEQAVQGAGTVQGGQKEQTEEQEEIEVERVAAPELGQRDEGSAAGAPAEGKEPVVLSDSGHAQPVTRTPAQPTAAQLVASVQSEAPAVGGPALAPRGLPMSMSHVEQSSSSEDDWSDCGSDSEEAQVEIMLGLSRSPQAQPHGLARARFDPRAPEAMANLAPVQSAEEDAEPELSSPVIAEPQPQPQDAEVVQTEGAAAAAEEEEFEDEVELGRLLLQAREQAKALDAAEATRGGAAGGREEVRELLQAVRAQESGQEREQEMRGTPPQPTPELRRRRVDVGQPGADEYRRGVSASPGHEWEYPADIPSHRARVPRDHTRIPGSNSWIHADRDEEGGALLGAPRGAECNLPISLQWFVAMVRRRHAQRSARARPHAVGGKAAPPRATDGGIKDDSACHWEASVAVRRPHCEARIGRYNADSVLPKVARNQGNRGKQGGGKKLVLPQRCPVARAPDADRAADRIAGAARAHGGPAAHAAHLLSLGQAPGEFHWGQRRPAPPLLAGALPWLCAA